MTLIKTKQFEIEVAELGSTHREAQENQVLWVRWNHNRIGEVQLRIHIDGSGGKPSILISHPPNTHVRVRQDQSSFTKTANDYIDLNTEEEERTRPSLT